MKLNSKIFGKGIAFAVLMSGAGNAFAETSLGTALGTLSGMQIQAQIEQLVSPIEKADIIKAFEEALNGNPPISAEEMRTILDGEMAKIQEEQQKLVNANLAAGEAFMEEYAKQDGVQKSENGILYRVIESGDGASPENVETQVTVHYTGKLMDDSVFDSSRERGEPATFALSQVIPGWREAVSMMKEGDQWEVVIPSELGYGPQGSGPIPGNSVLIFDIELINANAAAAE